MKIINDAFLKACRKEEASHISVWFMRQAGRYQPEYRAIREKYTLLEICRNPELCTQVTLLPVQQLGVDAAILFSDITLPFDVMGIPFDIKENIGPVIHDPIKTVGDIDKLKPLDPGQDLAYVGESIRMLKNALDVPLIGFVGAPFTLASYMIEGGPSKNFTKTKSFMYHEPEAWHELMDRLAVSMADYLRFQYENGASALQVFDSWVGNLSVEDYQEYVFPHMQLLFGSLKDLNTPLIHFGVVTEHLLELMKDCGPTVVGLDWRVRVDDSWKKLNYEVAVQGNLDPASLIAPWNIVEEKCAFILEQVDRPGFIFNLGHGIMPQASGDTLRRIVEYVHAWPQSPK